MNLNKIRIPLLMCILLNAFYCSYLFRPSKTFEEYPVFPAPDYSHLKTWMAHPGVNDLPDLSPSNSGYTDQQKDAKVDLFFIHGTTHLNKSSWNAAYDDALADKEAEQHMRNQVSIFNCCTRIFVPRYRQATIFSFLDKSEDSKKAIDFAYKDIESAFDNFIIQTKGRPFIIAGHSQGALHAKRLIKERIEGKELQKKIVVAYLIGHSVKPDYFSSFPVCKDENSISCYLSWSTFGINSKIYFFKDEVKGSVCTNPMSWKNNSEWISADKNLGSVPTTFDRIDKGLFKSKCDDGALRISKPEKDGYESFWDETYHNLDFNLFYVNIRTNLENRIILFLKNNS